MIAYTPDKARGHVLRMICRVRHNEEQGMTTDNWTTVITNCYLSILTATHFWLLV